MNHNLYVALLLVLVLSACKNNTPSTPDMKNETANGQTAGRIFATPFTLPYHAIPFDKITDADYMPAYIEGMRIHLLEIDSIANNTEPATFENTLVAMERAGQMLSRVDLAFNVLAGANTNEKLQAIQEEVAPKLSGHYDAISLNDKLFKRIKTVYDGRANLKLDTEDARLLDTYYKKFIMDGALLSESDKAKLKALNEQEAVLSAQYQNKLLGAAKNGALVVDNKAALAGLSDDEIKIASDKASENKQNGKWMIPLINTTQQPALQNLTNRATRETLFSNSWNRAERSDSNDTRKIILKLVQIRADKAKLLGFENYASWNLQDQMAQNPANVMELLKKLNAPSVKLAKNEAIELQKVIDEKGDKIKLEPWDWNYYGEMLRKKKYDLDENEIKPYFDADSVLKNGAFWAASKLYGVTFKPRTDIPVYNPDVKVYEIFDQDNQPMALYFCDFYKRDNKNGGAWMSNMVNQSKLLGTKPIIYNVFNYVKPVGGQASLISWDDVITIFHEFGHSLHGLFANQKYPSLSGTSTPRDFVEYPSQINEYWASYPAVLKNYARHYKTHEVIPQSLIDKIENAASFNQGYNSTEILEAANLDMRWHMQPATAHIGDVDSFELASLKDLGFVIPEVPSRYRSSYFLHIWANGYSAGYYAYLWSEVLDKDTRKWFEENGGLTRKNGDYFRKMILSKGNTFDFKTLYKTFRGRDADIKYFLKDKGLI